MNRSHFSRLLLAALIVALVVVWLVPGQVSRHTGPAASSLLLPGVDERINEVHGITVVRAGNVTAVTLNRGQERWTIAELDGYPAEWGRVRDFLAGMAQARVVEPKTDNPDYYHRLGVEDLSLENAKGVLVWLERADETHGVILGTTAQGRPGQYARLAGSPRSLLIDRVLDVPDNPEGWVDRDIADVAAGTVAEVEIIHPDGDWILARKAAATDTDFVLENLPEGRQAVSSWAVNSLAGALGSLRMDSVMPDTGEGADEPVRFRLLTFSGIEYTAELWASEEEHFMTVRAAVPAAAGNTGQEEGTVAEDADRAAQAAAFNERTAAWIFRIPEYKYSAMSKRLESLLKPPKGEDSGAS